MRKSTLHGCSYSNLLVYPKNWKTTTLKKSLNEIWVIKRIQSGKDDSKVIAYSTNTETYPDGKQIHEPFPIKKEKIRKVSLVIGHIVKEHSSGAVITI